MINRDIEKEMKLASQDYHSTFWNVLRNANGNANNIEKSCATIIRMPMICRLLL